LNAQPSCLNSDCTFVCNPNFVDCNGNPADGCECATAKCANGVCSP
jgi:hypothetical protein